MLLLDALEGASVFPFALGVSFFPPALPCDVTEVDLGRRLTDLAERTDDVEVVLALGVVAAFLVVGVAAFLVV